MLSMPSVAQSSSVPILLDMYVDCSVVKDSTHLQPRYNSGYDELLNGFDPFVTCHYQVNASIQALSEMSLRTSESWSVPGTQHFNSSKSTHFNFDYDIPTAGINDVVGLTEEGPYRPHLPLRVSVHRIDYNETVLTLRSYRLTMLSP